MHLNMSEGEFLEFVFFSLKVAIDHSFWCLSYGTVLNMADLGHGHTTEINVCISTTVKTEIFSHHFHKLLECH